MPSSAKRIPLIAGNWKMYTTLSRARSLAGEIAAGLTSSDSFRVGLFPPAISLTEVASAVAREGLAYPPLIGAQNIYFEREGAFTGEISAEMVESAGGQAVLVGHSERRHVFGETDDLVAKKVARALETGLTPVLCVGETLAERDSERTTEVVGRQLEQGLSLVSELSGLRAVIVAYEPVWAIGTGRTATPEQAEEVHEFIRGQLARLYGARGVQEADAEAESNHILYGGSVKPNNAQGLLEKPEIDGALVGGASLEAESFLSICKASMAVA